MKRVNLTGQISSWATPSAPEATPKVNRFSLNWRHWSWRRLSWSVVTLVAVFATGVGITAGLFLVSSLSNRQAVLPAADSRAENAITITSTPPENVQIKIDELFSYQLAVTASQPDKLQYEVTGSTGPISGLHINSRGYLWWQPTTTQAGRYFVTITVKDENTVASQSFPIEVRGVGQPQVERSDHTVDLRYQLGSGQTIVVHVPVATGQSSDSDDSGLNVSIAGQKLIISVPTWLYAKDAAGSWDPVTGKVVRSFKHANQKEIKRLQYVNSKEETVFLYTDGATISAASCTESCYSPYLKGATGGYYVSATITLPTNVTVEQRSAILTQSDQIVAGITVTAE